MALRILFAGSGEFGAPSLDALMSAGHEVAGVISQPDRPGREAVIAENRLSVGDRVWSRVGADLRGRPDYFRGVAIHDALRAFRAKRQQGGFCGPGPAAVTHLRFHLNRMDRDHECLDAQRP